MTRWLPIRPAGPPPRTFVPGNGRAGAPPTLFLDRDGVLVVDRDYLADPEGVELVPGTAAALRDARAAGFQLIAVSNQSGLGRGRFAQADLDAVMQRMTDLLRAAGAALDAVYYCPHAPQDDCACRKPRPGLLDEAAVDFRWEPARSWVVGDKISDVDLALGAGLRPCLVRTGYGAEQEARLADRPAVLVADDLAAAVAAILERT